MHSFPCFDKHVNHNMGLSCSVFSILWCGSISPALFYIWAFRTWTGARFDILLPNVRIRIYHSHYFTSFRTLRLIWYGNVSVLVIIDTLWFGIFDVWDGIRHRRWYSAYGEQITKQQIPGSDVWDSRLILHLRVTREACRWRRENDGMSVRSVFVQWSSALLIPLLTSSMYILMSSLIIYVTYVLDYWDL